jgi:hypothetical protein
MAENIALKELAGYLLACVRDAAERIEGSPEIQRAGFFSSHGLIMIPTRSRPFFDRLGRDLFDVALEAQGPAADADDLYGIWRQRVSAVRRELVLARDILEEIVAEPQYSDISPAMKRISLEVASLVPRLTSVVQSLDGLDLLADPDATEPL